MPIQQPNPSKSFLALYPEKTDPGLVDFTHRHDMDFNGRDKFGSGPGLLPRTIISGLSEQQPGLTAKNNPTGGFGADAFNPMCHDFMIGSFFGHCSDPVEVVAGEVFKTTYSLVESNNIERTFAASIYRDDQLLQWAYGCGVQQFVIGAKPRGLIDCDFTVLAQRLDYWDNEGAVITGTGLIAPLVRGIADNNFHTFTPVLANGKVTFKIVSNTSSLFTAKVKVGTAAYGTDVQTFYKLAWNEVLDQDGADIGFRLEVYPPSGTYVVDDEIMIPCRKEAVWSGYTAAPNLPLSEVTSTIIIPSYAASVGRLQNVTFTAKAPLTYIDGVGGLWPAGILKRGEYAYDLTYDLDVLDDTTRGYIEMRRPYTVILDFRAESVIPTTNFRPRMTITLENIIGTGSTSMIADQHTYKDTVKASAFLPAPACKIEIWNGNDNPTDA